MQALEQAIKLIFLGDITGRQGRTAVKSYVSDIKKKNEDCFIIANIENASHGFGLTKKNYHELLEYGIDCLTSGNHIWDKREIFEYIDEADRLIRPINYPRGTHGCGYRIIEKDGYKVGVINVLGRTFMGIVDSSWELLEQAIEEIKKETPKMEYLDYKVL